MRMLLVSRYKTNIADYQLPFVTEQGKAIRVVGSDVDGRLNPYFREGKIKMHSFCCKNKIFCIIFPICFDIWDFFCNFAH